MLLLFGVAALWRQGRYSGYRDRNGHLPWDQLVVRGGGVGWRQGTKALRRRAEFTVTQTSGSCSRGRYEHILVTPGISSEGFDGNLRGADGDRNPSTDCAPAIRRFGGRFAPDGCCVGGQLADGPTSQFVLPQEADSGGRALGLSKLPVL